MSHTDKHRPDWVQAMDPDNRAFITVKHDHSNGVCDMETDPKRRSLYWNYPNLCHIYITAYGYHGGIWPGPGKSWKVERRIREGRMRSDWIKHRKNLMTMDDPEDYEGDIRPRHRHSVLWDVW